MNPRATAFFFHINGTNLNRLKDRTSMYPQSACTNTAVFRWGPIYKASPDKNQ